MSEIPGSIAKVMNYGTIEPVSEIRLFAKCVECMENVMKMVSLERKSESNNQSWCVYTGFRLNMVMVKA